MLVAAAVALAPAAALDIPLSAATHQRLRLTDAAGVWWNGHGVLATADGAARLPLAWTVAIAPLLAGAVVVTLDGRGDDAMPSGSISLHRESVALRNFALRAPARFLSATVPALRAVTLAGDVALHAPVIDWNDGALRGAFDARWQAAGVVAGGFVLDLGIVSASAATKNDVLAGTIANSGGDIALDGTVEQHRRAVGASLDLKPRASAPDAVRVMLPLLGASDGAGGVRVEWRGG